MSSKGQRNKTSLNFGDLLVKHNSIYHQLQYHICLKRDYLYDENKDKYPINKNKLIEKAEDKRLIVELPQLLSGTPIDLSPQRIKRAKRMMHNNSMIDLNRMQNIFRPDKEESKLLDSPIKFPDALTAQFETYRKKKKTEIKINRTWRDLTPNQSLLFLENKPKDFVNLSGKYNVQNLVFNKNNNYKREPNVSKRIMTQGRISAFKDTEKNQVQNTLLRIHNEKRKLAMSDFSFNFNPAKIK